MESHGGVEGRKRKGNKKRGDERKGKAYRGCTLDATYIRPRLRPSDGKWTAHPIATGSIREVPFIYINRWLFMRPSTKYYIRLIGCHVS